MIAMHSRSVAALLLAGTALVSTTPALADAGRILSLGAGQRESTPLIPGERVTTKGVATQVMIRDGGILSFVGEGSFTLAPDGGITIHSGNATVLASARLLTVTLPDGSSATLPVGGSSSFTPTGGRITGHVLTGSATLASGGGSRGFTAGQAWRAGGGQTPDLVIANAAQAAPPAVASQRQGGLAAAAFNGQPVGLGQALAALGASGDIVAAAARLQASAQNPALASIPAVDAAALANYAEQLSRLYGGPAFSGASADLVRAYLGYLGQGGSIAGFQSAYADLVARYIDLLRSGGLPASFAGASEAAINAYLAYIRSTGALDGLSAENRAFITAYLGHLTNGGGAADFTASYVNAINAYLAYLREGGLPSHYAGLSADLIRQYLEFLQSSGLLSSLLAEQQAFLTAYLAHVQGGGDPDQFAGLPGGGTGPGPVDPRPGTEMEVAGSTVVLIDGREVHAPIDARRIAFTGGRPDAIPDGTTIMVTDRAGFAEVHADDRFFLGRLTDGSFRVGQDYPLSANQGVHYAYLRTGDLTLPQSGTAHYDLLAATRPTFVSGATAPGAFDADLAIAWGSTPRVGIAGTLTMPDDAAYTLATGGGIAGVAATGALLVGYGQTGYRFDAALTGSGRACSLSACTVRFLVQPGGPDAGALATTYASYGGEGDDRLSGAAAFVKGAAPVDPAPVDPDPPVTPPPSSLKATGMFILGDTADTYNMYNWNVETGSDGVLRKMHVYDFTAVTLLDRTVSASEGWEIGRFTNGKVMLEQTQYAVGNGQAAHYVLATPVVTLPAAGTARYALHAYTMPTYKDGRIVLDARMNGTLGVNFANRTWGYKGGLAVLHENGAHNYSFAFGDPDAPTRRLNDLGRNNHVMTGGVVPVMSDDAACASGTCRAGVALLVAGETGEMVVGTYQVGTDLNLNTVSAFLGGALVFRDEAAGGGIVEPAPTGTQRTDQFIAYSGSGIGIDQRTQVTTTTEADGTLNAYLWTGNPVEAPARGSNASFETGTAGGVIGWSRWADGISGGRYFDGPPFARTDRQGMHLVYGTPATDLPASGTVSYALVGATSPTIRDGSVAPGSFSGSAAVAFGSTAKVGLDMQISIGGHDYAVATTGGIANPASSQLNVASTMGFRSDLTIASGGPACTGSSCTATVTGFLAGTGASHLGLSYTIGGGANFNQQVDGAAVFAR